MLLYTFCVDIGRHRRVDLMAVFDNLMNSIHKHIPEYKMICFTNFDNELKLNVGEKYNVEYRKYYDKQVRKLYNDKWLNLSFNKINIYRDLYEEFKEDYCWIDLDTVVCYDISYMNNLSNVFIENGGIAMHDNILFTNDKSITVPRNRYIQGDFWKLNIELYNKLMVTLDVITKQGLCLRYDLQDLFTYYRYIFPDGEHAGMNIIGNNIRNETINGLCVWSKAGNTHATMDGLRNLFVENGHMKSKFYPTKEIHLLSFTFFTLTNLYKTNEFNHIFPNTG